MFSKKKNNKGFTLVELLVVIAIIGVLAVVALPALFKNIEKSKVASLEADISALKSASMSYVASNNTYPTGISGEGLSTISGILNAYGDELENLSNPFDATYTLKSSNTGDLTLKVDLGNNKTFSIKSLEKLYSDLGSALTLVGDTEPTGTFEAGSQTITIKIMNANGVTSPAAS